MGFHSFTPEQIRVLNNAQQLFEVFETHRLKSNSVTGSMHWKTIKGNDYLYRISSTGRKQTSCGVRSPETEQIKLAFDDQKRQYKARENELIDNIHVHAAYIKANRLNRFPIDAARIIRVFAQAGAPCRIIGTNALYLYEKQAGVLIEPEHLATEDIDLFFDARQKVKILSSIQGTSLLTLLKKADKSFEKLTDSPFEFSAANNRGYRVDFITQGDTHLIKDDDFERQLDASDLKPIAINSLKWLASTPSYTGIVFDSKGMPLRVKSVDPRVFVLHKWHTSQQPDREPTKRSRDEDQARLMSTILANHLRNLPYARAIEKIFPRTVSRNARAEMDDFSL